MSPPENGFPADVGVTVLPARSDDVAVGLTQVEAFSTGCRFTLAVSASARGAVTVVITWPGFGIEKTRDP